MATRIRAPLRALAFGPRELDTEQAHYLLRVLRLRDGDTFVAFDPARAVECDATIVAGSDGIARAQLGEIRDAIVQATRDVTLIQGLAKGDKCDAIVRDATELGATRIVFVGMVRSMVKLDAARAPARVERWERIAEEAARQCRRGDAPPVELAPSWREALAAVSAEAARFTLYELAVAPLGPALAVALAGDGPLAFAIGPEGGIDAAEVLDAEAAGFESVSLGPFILRTETVASAVLGACLVTSAYPPAAAPTTRS